MPENEPSENPFASIKGGVDAGTITGTERLAIAIVGKPKSGKSRFAATIPGQTFCADFDNRRESLAGRGNVYVKTYNDTNPVSPTAIKELEQDLAKFKYAHAQGKKIPDNFMLDSFTFFKKFLDNEIMSQAKAAGVTNMHQDFKVGTKVVRIGRGWDMVNACRGYMEYFIAEFRELGNVICVFHERLEKDIEASTKDVVRYTGGYTVDPPFLASLLSVFNEVWRIEVDDKGVFKAHCRQNAEFNASTSLLIDKVEEPDIAKILAKHEQNLRNKAK